MKLEFCHTLSTESIQIDVPDIFAKDLEHVVIINEGEAYQLKSTIPDEIKKKNNLRKEFEDKHFEYLRVKHYSDLDENSDPVKFEENFNETVTKIISLQYPELNKIINEQILHTLCVHFVVYAVYKNREEKLMAKNEAQKEDRCYAKDFAKRLIKLFGMLSFSDPGSIRKFSEELNAIEKFMKSDRRRHAGYDKLFTGISATVTMLANAFITKDGEQKINIVKAFEETAAGANNLDRQALIKKVIDILDNTIKYYNNYIDSINKTEADIATIFDDISMSYLAVARGISAQFINDTDAFLNESAAASNDSEKQKELRLQYKLKLEMFCYYFDDLVAAFDDATDNTMPTNEFATTLSDIWSTINQMKSSESDTWPTELAKYLFDNFEKLFGAVPNNAQVNKKSN